MTDPAAAARKKRGRPGVQLSAPAKLFIRNYVKAYTKKVETPGSNQAAPRRKRGFLAKDLIVRPPVHPPTRRPPVPPASHAPSHPHHCRPHQLPCTPRPARAQDQVVTELRAVFPTEDTPDDKAVLLFLTEEGQPLENVNLTYWRKGGKEPKFIRYSTSGPSFGLGPCTAPRRTRRTLPHLAPPRATAARTALAARRPAPPRPRRTLAAPSPRAPPRPAAPRRTSPHIATHPAARASPHLAAPSPRLAAPRRPLAAPSAQVAPRDARG